MRVASEQQPACPVSGDTLSIARLHGEACVVCGVTEGLVDAGHVYTEGTEEGSRLGWAVRACPPHAHAVDARESP